MAFNVCLAASVVIVAFKCAVFTSGSERKAKYSNSETKESKIADINGYWQKTLSMSKKLKILALFNWMKMSILLFSFRRISKNVDECNDS